MFVIVEISLNVRWSKVVVVVVVVVEVLNDHHAEQLISFVTYYVTGTFANK